MVAQVHHTYFKCIYLGSFENHLKNRFLQMMLGNISRGILHSFLTFALYKVKLDNVCWEKKEGVKSMIFEYISDIEYEDMVNVIYFELFCNIQVYRVCIMYFTCATQSNYFLVLCCLIGMNNVIDPFGHTIILLLLCIH